VSEYRPLNPPILGDFELRKVVNSPQIRGAGGAKNFSDQTKRGLFLILSQVCVISLDKEKVLSCLGRGKIRYGRQTV